MFMGTIGLINLDIGGFFILLLFFLVKSETMGKMTSS